MTTQQWSYRWRRQRRRWRRWGRYLYVCGTIISPNTLYFCNVIFYTSCVCLWVCEREREGGRRAEREGGERLYTCEPTSAISNYIIPIIRLTYCWKEKRRISKLDVSLLKTQYDILPGTCVFIRFMYLKCVRRKPTLNH